MKRGLERTFTEDRVPIATFLLLKVEELLDNLGKDRETSWDTPLKFEQAVV